MSTTATTWSTSALRTTETTPKISEPGIYSALVLSGVESDDKKFKYTFTTREGDTYTDMAIFFTANPEYTKSVEDQQKANIEKMISIADAVSSPTEVSKLPPATSYIQLCNMLHKFIESKKGAKVNIKLVLDKDQNFANPAMFGFIEKHIDGFDPKLYFTTWEKDNDRAKRTKPRPKPEAKSDTAARPGESADFSAFLAGATIATAALQTEPTTDASGLPF